MRSDSEKLVIKAGGVLIGNNRHRVYLLDGVRFTFHKGSKNSDYFRTTAAVRSRLRKLGKL